MADQTAREILVVEDDEDILTTLEAFLEDEGYIALTASNGSDALEILAKGERPTLILLDMRMPILDGWQFAAKVRERYGGALRIVAMTAAPDAGERAKEIGATAFLSKPFELDALRELIKVHTP